MTRIEWENVLNLHSCISVMEQVKINEQDRLMGTGLSMYKPNLNFPAGRYGKFESQVVSDVATLQNANARPQILFYHREMVQHEVLKIGSG